MQSLLRWSIENSTPESNGQSNASSGVGQLRPTDQAPQEPKPLDPELIDLILGKQDSELMKEALVVAVDIEKSDEERLRALDDFETLIENIDNANNIEKLGMWPTLQELLSSPRSSDNIRCSVLWVIGTAVQNNPAAQHTYLTLPISPLSAILEYLSPREASSKTRSKAVYALSGILKHNTEGVKAFDESGGWEILKGALRDPDISVRRKTVFLLNNLLLSSATATAQRVAVDRTGARMHGAGISDDAEEPPQVVHANSHARMTTESIATAEFAANALEKHGILTDLVQSLVNPIPYGSDGDHERDADYEEKAVRLFVSYTLSGRMALDQKDKNDLLQWITESRDGEETWDLSAEELDSLRNALST